VVSAAWVKSSLADRAGIGTAQVFVNAECAVAVATIHGSLIKLVALPYLCRVASHLVMTFNAGVERVAALVFDSDNIAVRSIVCALRPAIYLRTAN
jgi:hypothetical protein